MIGNRTVEDKMTVQDIAVVALALGAFSVFGIALGFATWDDSRQSRKARK